MYPQNPSYQYSFIDILNIMSFMIGLENLQANLTQSDKQDLINDFTNRTDRVLYEMHEHLKEQDHKIDLILAYLQDLKEDPNYFR